MLFRRGRGANGSAQDEGALATESADAEERAAIDVRDRAAPDRDESDHGASDQSEFGKTAVDLAGGDGDATDAAATLEREEAAQASHRVPRSSRFGRARGFLSAPLGGLRRGARVDAGVIEELEEALLLADVGYTTTARLLDGLRSALAARAIAADTEGLIAYLREAILNILLVGDATLHHDASVTNVWLFVGVNGVGKTTTIGKLASRERSRGRKVVLAAGDTFRAAAGEQLDLWASRAQVEIVQGANGADPSSVIFDAIAHAHAVGADLVLADSAGRLHNKTNLMEELRKVRRVADREPGHVVEVLLVLDATTGQNGLTQAREFAAAVGITGVVLTKLDGTAKGGIVLAISSELGLPIKLVGLGEGIDDLAEFDPHEFVDALFFGVEAGD